MVAPGGIVVVQRNSLVSFSGGVPRLLLHFSKYLKRCPLKGLQPHFGNGNPWGWGKYHQKYSPFYLLKEYNIHLSQLYLFNFKILVWYHIFTQNFLSSIHLYLFKLQNTFIPVDLFNLLPCCSCLPYTPVIMLVCPTYSISFFLCLVHAVLFSIS